MKLAEIAQKLGCRLEGPPELEIRGVAGMEYAEAGQITFLANRRYFPLLHSTLASAVLVEEGIKMARHPDLPPLAALRGFVPLYRVGRFGDDFFPHAHPVVAGFCRVGDRVILPDGVVIGGHG